MNLDIGDYSKNELEEVLSLNYPYSHSDVVEKKKKLHDKLLNDSNLGIDFKSKIGGFLDNLSDRLIGDISEGIRESHPNNPEVFEQLGENTMIENDNHMLIKDPYTEGAYSASPESGRIVGGYGAPPGILNPIKYKTIKKALNIDTRFRDNYFNTISTNVHLTLPYKFEKVISMNLASMEIPLTYYAISAAQNNNTFVVEYRITGPARIMRVPVVLPDGNYEPAFSNQTDATPIEIAVNNALKGAGAGATRTVIATGVTTQFPQPAGILWDPAVGADLAIRFTVDRTSGRSVFAQDKQVLIDADVDGLDYRIYFNVQQNGDLDETQPMPMKFGWQLGFRSAVYNSTGVGPDTIDVVPAIASEGICFLRGPQYIFIAVDDYNNNVNNSFIQVFSDSISNKNILARINVSSIQQRQGIYQSAEADGFFTRILGSRQYFGPVDIQKMKLTLYDDFGRILNLNNMDWSITLMFECLYN